MPRRSLLLAAALAGAAVALPPAAAQAATVCVAPSGCQFTGLADALDAANSDPAADRIELRAGAFDLDGSVLADGDAGRLEVVGAGRGQTVVRITDTHAPIYAGGDVLLSDLRIEYTGSTGGVALSGATLASVDVVADGSTGGPLVTLSGGATVRDVGIAMPVTPGPLDPATATYGVEVQDDGDAVLERLSIAADFGIAVGDAGTGVTRVRNARLATGVTGLGAGPDTTTDVDGLLVTPPAGTPGVGIAVNANGGAADVSLRHATLQLPPVGIAGIAIGGLGGPAGVGTVRARDVVVRGGQAPVRMVANGGAANLDVAYSALDVDAITKNGTDPENAVVVRGDGIITPFDLGLPESGDPVPGRGSRLIDAGEPRLVADPLAATVDLLGTARVLDGNADGVARSDIGAFEHVPPAPQPGPPPTDPGAGAGGGGGGGTPPTTVPRVDPGGSTPRGVARPRLALPKGGLRLDARGRARVKLVCPAGGGQCTGTLTLRSAKKIAVGGRRAVATLGSARYTIAAGGSRTVTVSLKPALRTYVRRKGKLATVAQVAPSGGSASTVGFTLRKAARRG